MSPIINHNMDIKIRAVFNNLMDRRKWNFNSMSDDLRAIIGNQGNLDKIRVSDIAASPKNLQPLFYRYVNYILLMSEWDFSSLSWHNKHIVGNQEGLNELKKFIQERVKDLDVVEKNIELDLNSLHPWGLFLAARLIMARKLRSEGKTSEEITNELSLNPGQIDLIFQMTDGKPLSAA